MGYKDEAQISNFKFQNELMAEKPKPIDRLKARIEAQYLPEHFSYSQLAAFEKCPLQYKFAFILKVPTRGKAVFSFGKTMHNTLHEFLRTANEEKKFNQKNLFSKKEVESPKSADSAYSKVLENFGISGLNEVVRIYEKNWIDEWYETKKQKDEYYKLGKKIIKEFYGGFSKNPPEILRIKGELALELPFNLKIGEHTLFGVIDRIDKTGD